MANRYAPLLMQAKSQQGSEPLRDRYEHSMNGAARMPPPSGIAVPPPSGIAVPPEPLTEPLTEPLSYVNIAATKVAGVKDGRNQEEEDNRESKSVIGGHFTALPQDLVIEVERSKTTIAECYRRAIHYEGALGGSRVGLALKSGGDPDQVLQEIIDAVEEECDLGLALSHYWQEWTR
jgi:hypothetical protein